MKKSEIHLYQAAALYAACDAALQRQLSYGGRFKLRGIMRDLAVQLKDLDAEREALIAQYAVKGEDGAPLMNGDSYDWGEHKEEVDRSWRECNDVTVGISHKLVLDDVAGLQGGPELDALELLLD